jgi:uncharacterized protein YdaT
MKVKKLKGELSMCFFRKRRARKLAEKAKLSQVNQEKSEVTNVEEPKVQESKVEPAVTATEKPESNNNKQEKPKKYHVSQNKEEGTENFKKWRVRKEGSTKTIKFFDTQKDAIAYAEDLALSAGSSVVIHKVDGSIRKQDYQKKA